MKIHLDIPTVEVIPDDGSDWAHESYSSLHAVTAVAHWTVLAVSIAFVGFAILSGVLAS
ncbi:hypothetical protein WKW79_20845 [Variovorax robiniae]|uniref:Uncharacterized protein n=1 Tax=Variovorax robiniae TaxID=1836199 RepID=A0ABU8XB15_9BURK